MVTARELAAASQLPRTIDCRSGELRGLCPMAAVSDYGAREVHIPVQSMILGLACVVLRSYDAVIGFICLF